MIGYVISKQERNFFKKIFNKLDIEEYENGKKYIIPKLNQKVIEKLKKEAYYRMQEVLEKAESCYDEKAEII